ncbi:MAG: hypothetical protein ABI696_01255 [Rubrivivax sp.]
MNRALRLCLLTLPLWLAGCDLLGIESASDVAARREADGKAVGGACRHAGRAIEDCFTLNKRSERAAVFAGWREMNDYMAERQIAALPAAGATAPEASQAPVQPADASRPGSTAPQAPTAGTAAASPRTAGTAAASPTTAGAHDGKPTAHGDG